MLRNIVNAALRTPFIAVKRSLTACNQTLANPPRLVLSVPSSGICFYPAKGLTSIVCNALLAPSQTNVSQERTVTKFTLNKGKRKSVKAVVKRFKRLDWGCWIRTHSGRHKKLFKKSPALRRRLKQHIFVNAAQSFLLDKMVTSFWRKPKHYIDDPYEPYMKREEYWSTKTKPTGY